MGKIMSWAVAGGLTAGAVTLAMGGGAGAGAAAAGSGAGAGMTGAGAAGAGAGLLPATTIGTGATGSIAGGTGLTAGTVGAGTGIGGGLQGILSSRYGQLAGVGLSALGGALPNTASQTGTSMPTLDPAYGPLQSLLLQQTLARLNSGGPDMAGYTAGGMQNINKAYGLVGQSLDNSLTSRGLAGSPIAGAGDAKLQTGRAGDLANFQNTIPLLKDQYQQQALQQATGLLTQGRGTTSTGSQTSGGGWAGAATNLAQMLGYLYGTQGRNLAATA
jgi:hypothetical protein